MQIPQTTAMGCISETERKKYTHTQNINSISTEPLEKSEYRWAQMMFTILETYCEATGQDATSKHPH
jgi:hypothetical protein